VKPNDNLYRDELLTGVSPWNLLVVEKGRFNGDQTEAAVGLRPAHRFWSVRFDRAIPSTNCPVSRKSLEGLHCEPILAPETRIDLGQELEIRRNELQLLTNQIQLKIWAAFAGPSLPILSGDVHQTIAVERAIDHSQTVPLGWMR
jgi:hypothetical protein